ncbi:MAG: hypothetical protein JW940_16350 [Polyangiaceae bacterium]|nr:hypothetical protein [Polyangiaceae bacterium]
MRSVLPALVGMCSLACAGTPQTDPLPDRPELHGDLVHRVSGRTRGMTVALEGQPGSAEPPGAVVHVVDLYGTGAPVEAPVSDDGSFDVTIEMDAGGVVRLDVRDGAQRSDPVDLVIGTDSLSPAQPALACWTTSGPVVTLTRAGGAVTITNDCDESIALSRVALRSPNASFTLGAVPAEVPSGSAAEIAVGYAPSEPGSDEEILHIEIDAPLQDRRAVTLVGVNQP